MKIKHTIIIGVVLSMLFGLISPAMAGIFTDVYPDPFYIPPPVEEPTLDIKDLLPILIPLLPPFLILLIQPYI